MAQTAQGSAGITISGGDLRNRCVNVALGTWFSGGIGSAGGTAGLDDLKGFSNLNNYDSQISSAVHKHLVKSPLGCCMRHRIQGGDECSDGLEGNRKLCSL